jgi:hypothetical protein
MTVVEMTVNEIRMQTELGPTRVQPVSIDKQRYTMHFRQNQFLSSQFNEVGQIFSMKRQSDGFTVIKPIRLPVKVGLLARDEYGRELFLLILISFSFDSQFAYVVERSRLEWVD